MKKYFLLFSIALMCANDLHRINSIEATVPGTTHIVTSLDILQRGFDGSNMNLEEILLEHLLEIYGQEVFSMNVDDEMIDRYLEKMGLPKKQLEHMADMWLFNDLPEFYMLFKRVHGSGGTMQQIIESLLTVTEDFLETIYKENPQWREPALLIKTAVIKLTDTRKDKIIRQLILDANYDKIKGLKWDEESWSLESELAPQVKFLTGLQQGDIASRDFDNEIVLYKVVQKRDKELIPLAERRSELLQKAREKKYVTAKKEALESVKNRHVSCLASHTSDWQEAELDASVVKPV